MKCKRAGCFNETWALRVDLCASHTDERMRMLQAAYDKEHAKVADLRARLRAVREQNRHLWLGTVVDRATDLRRRKWRRA